MFVKQKTFKKQALEFKLTRIIKFSNFLLCIQPNNFNTLDWSFLKKEVSSLKEVNILLIKNKITKKLLKTKTVADCFLESAVIAPPIQLKPQKASTDSATSATKKIELPAERGHIVSSPIEAAMSQLFQGPTFFIGCNNIELVVPLLRLINNNKKLVVIGGVLQKKIINHLDLSLLKQLDKTIFNKLVNIIERPVVDLVQFNQKHSKNLLMLLKTKDLSSVSADSSETRVGEAAKS